MLRKEKVLEKLKEVIDPETGIDIVSMNLVKDVIIESSGIVIVKFSPTVPFCPLLGYLVSEIKKKVEELDEVSKCDVQVSFNLSK
ncbi:MAG TPA: metal-sulfur cluster assembly factor [Archaeoglobus sp.]|nr:metal-sulfur cluster assembly factor [Archaeoglobus sp.]